jgi:membrane-bound ClpP family serine protease
MKRFFLPFVFLCLVYNVTFARQTKVYVLRLDSEIHAKSARMLDKAMKAAGDWDANVFLLHLNTYGSLWMPQTKCGRPARCFIYNCGLRRPSGGIGGHLFP